MIYDLDHKIGTGFDALTAAYASVPGDALPEAPSRWSPLHPNEEQLATPFGRLFAAIASASATGTEGSLAFELNARFPVHRHDVVKRCRLLP